MTDADQEQPGQSMNDADQQHATPESARDAGPTITFVIGASRSGTTWLARALGSDQRVTATYETHLFNAYLGPLLSTWREHHDGMIEQSERWLATGHPPESAIGLPFVLEEEQLLNSLRRLVADVFDSVVVRLPDVQAIVEKTPSHSGFVDEIDLLTDGRARFVHIIRNGFDVVDSTITAGSGWASDWAPRDAATAARKWAAGVTGARGAAKFEGRYHELRYEDFLAEPEKKLLEVFRFIGVDADADDASAALANTDEGLFLGGAAQKHFGDTFPEPKGFRRTDRRDRSARNRAIVTATVGPLLEELGYAEPTTAAPARQRAWLVSGAIETNLARVGRLIDRVRSDVQQRL